MANIFRTLRRKLAGSELEAMGRDLDQFSEQLQVLSHKLEGLANRYDRLDAKLRMRELRRGAERPDGDEAILAELERARRAGGDSSDVDWMKGDPWGGH